jgi:hypothetical protein
MNLYVYNPLKAPLIVGRITLPARTYAVVNEQQANAVHNSSCEAIVEGDAEFEPLFATNIPAKTPNEID